MGPETLCRCPETELPGLGSPAAEGLDLNAVMDCETPLASVNCSRSSTFVRPLAARRGGGKIGLALETASTKGRCVLKHQGETRGYYGLDKHKITISI